MTEKEQLELKYARLRDAKFVLAQMIRICKQNDNVLECIKTSIKSIQKLSESELLVIPSYNKILELPLLSTSGENSQIYKKIVEDNNKMLGYINSIGSTLSNEMTNVAHAINNCKE